MLLRKCAATVCSFVMIILLIPLSVSSEDYPAQLKKPIETSITIRKKTQNELDDWFLAREKLKTEYEKLAEERDGLKARRELLRQKVDAQQKAVESLETQQKEISRISAELSPFLQQTVRRLLDFIQEDLPFLAEERRQRLLNLRKTLDDPMVPQGEKFRKLMETLFVEAEYGSTAEIYRDRIDYSDAVILVDIFRLGRVSLYFRTLDGRITGTYDPESESWKPLSEKHGRQVYEAMEMAAKRRSVELVNLPVGRIERP